MKKTLFLIPALASALYGKEPCKVNPDVERYAHANGNVATTTEPKTSSQSVGNLQPGCYTIIPTKEGTLYFSKDGERLGSYFQDGNDWVFKDRDGSQRVYASKDPTSFIYSQYMLEGKHHTHYARDAQPVFQVVDNKLVPVTGEQKSVLQNYARGYKTARAPIGTFFVKQGETVDEKTRTLEGRQVTIDDKCLWNLSCAVEPREYPTKR